MRPGFIILLIASIYASGCSSRHVRIVSPDKKIVVTFFPGLKNDTSTIPAFSLETEGRKILLPSAIMIRSNLNFSQNRLKTIKVEKEHYQNSWINDFGERKVIPDNYTQVKIFLESNGLKLNFIFRAYNEGIAFLYEFPELPGNNRAENIIITDEEIGYRFPSDYPAWSAPRAQAQYTKVPISEINEGCERPLVIEIDSALIIALTEAKLVNYARMKYYTDTSSGNSIRSRLDGEVIRSVPFQSPWRVILIGKDPGNLLEKNYLILNLNDPGKIDDVSWIRPGKVLREVTLTTAGAKAAIDFTSSHNMQYVEFDAGWYGPENSNLSDARAVNVDPARSKGPLDLQEVIRYAKTKGIDILLYVNRKALERQIDTLLPLYKSWGIAGIKFGFVQVGTQDATWWLHESIRKAAEYELVADVHDEYRPTGFSRTYPNFLTMEGIRGDEESPSNSHTLTTMFTRMLAGQGDNTICYFNERVENKMGSHASQLAKAVCIFSPLQFLYWYDKAAPDLEKNDGLWGSTNYIGNEPELEFFDNVPTVWDETRVLYARIGEYGVIARRKGDQWFIGGINGTQESTFILDFSFLNPNIRYMASVYTDDPAIDTRTHVKIERIEIVRNSVYTLKVRADNGFAMHITPK